MSSPICDLIRPSTSPDNLYKQDDYTRAKQQAGNLRRRDLEQIDWNNVIEEIESVGRSEKTRWASHCAIANERMLAVKHCSFLVEHVAT